MTAQFFFSLPDHTTFCLSAGSEAEAMADAKGYAGKEPFSLLRQREWSVAPSARAEERAVQSLNAKERHAEKIRRWLDDVNQRAREEGLIK